MGLIQFAREWDSLPNEPVRLADRWVNRGLVAVYLPSGYSTRTGIGKYTSGSQAPGRIYTATASGQAGVQGTNSLFVVANLNGTARDAVAFGRIRYNGSANFGTAIRFNSTTLEINKADGGAGWGFNTQASAILTGLHSYGAVSLPGVASLGFRDGVQLAMSGSAGATNLTVVQFDGAMNVGQGSASGATAVTQAIDGDVKIAAHFLEQRTADEFAELHARPLSLLAPRRIWVPVSVGGASTNLTVPDAAHAHAADNVVLTTVTSLTVADATHAHAADAVTLVVGSVLSVAEAAHAHAADAPTLSVQSTLAVAEASHAHAADAVTLAVQSTLAVAESTHGHAADNVTLDVAGSTNLTVAEALHAHAVDALALTSAHALIVADATHGHAVDGLTLTAGSVLAIQEALHSHAADGITLDVGDSLLIADALHAHTSDGLALTVAAWLVLADALHGHAAENVQLDDGGGTVTALTVAEALHAHLSDGLSLTPLYPVVVLSAPPIGHGPALGRRTTSAGRSRPSQLNSRTR